MIEFAKDTVKDSASVWECTVEGRWITPPNSVDKLGFIFVDIVIIGNSFELGEYNSGNICGNYRRGQGFPLLEEELGDLITPNKRVTGNNQIQEEILIHFSNQQ